MKPVCADTIYFTNKGTGSIWSFTWTPSTSGTVTPTLVASGIQSPSGMAVGSDGNLYVTETGSNKAGAITRINPSDRVASRVVDLPGTNPAGIAFLPGGGNMIVSSLEPSDDAQGTVLFSISGWSGTSASAAPYSSYALTGGAAVATTSAGTLFVSNNPGYNGDVLSFTSGTAAPATLIASGSAVNQTAAPTGLLVDGSTLYSLSITDARVMKTDLSLLTTGSLTTLAPYSYPSTLASLSDGRLLVGTANYSGQFFVVNPLDGNSTSFFVSGFPQVGGIVAVPEPAALSLTVIGLASVGWLVRRRHSSFSR